MARLPSADELQRCYVGVAGQHRMTLHFFDGAQLEPVALREAGAARWEDAGLAILADYLDRTENRNKVEALGEAFITQFVANVCGGGGQVLFIEEHRVEDWLRVMQMLGEAA